MNLKKLNETFDRLCKSGLFGKKVSILKEDWGQDDIEKLKQLVESGEEENIQIAMQICQGFGIDFFEEILPDYKALIYFFERNQVFGKKGDFDFYSAKYVAHFLNKTTLNIEEKDITWLPPQVSFMRRLKYVYLSHNRGLRQLPDSLGNMGLVLLDIVGTTVSTIPNTFVTNPINKELTINYSYELNMPEEKIEALKNNIRELKEFDI